MLGRRRSGATGADIAAVVAVVVVVVFVAGVISGGRGGVAAEREGLVDGVGKVEAEVEDREVVSVEIHFFL